MRIGIYSIRGKFKARIALALICAFFLSVIYLFFERVYPNYINRVDIYMENTATALINSALSEAMRSTDASDFEIINTDTDGNITSVESNTYEMNLFKARYTDILLEKIKDNPPGYVIMPLGSLSGKEIFSGIGPRIKIKTEINGMVKTDFCENFVSCGINQVKHKIFIDVSVRFSAISATMHRSRTIKTTIPVSETVISGVVPKYYGSGLNTSLTYENPD